MSTDTQLKGDSLRRQLEASENYARNNNLELVNSIDGISLEDIGVSAFKSKNTQKGVLSLFLDSLDNGKIKRDSVLLIESLDRLSRDRLSEALPQFISILNKGVEIVTLADGQRYTKEIINQNPGALFVSLGVMFRANEESEIKSRRLSAAWSNKRNNSSTKILTKTAPAWLEYSAVTGKFQLTKEKAEIVKKIFDMCINTCGLFSIARYLNEKKVPVFGKGKIWYVSYVKKIIENRSVLGEFQPHHYVEGKREKIGDPISNYFPAVIDEQTFLLAQVSMARRSTLSKGRKGKSFSNLFTSLAYCGLCGYKLHLKDRGGKKASSKYLLCSNQMVSAGCNLTPWNYADFESVLFEHLREIDFSELIDTSNDDKEVSLDDQLEVAKENHRNKEIEIERAIDFVLGSELSEDVKQRFQNKINQLEADKKELEKEINDLSIKIEEKNSAKEIFNSADLKEVLDQIDARKDDYLFRSGLNQYLVKLIDKVELYEGQNQLNPWELDEEDEVIIAFRNSFKTRQKISLDALLDHPDFEAFHRAFNRTIKIKYKNGAERYLMWGKEVSIRL